MGSTQLTFKEHIGDFEYSRESFSETEEFVQEISSPEFQKKNLREKYLAISNRLVQLILDQTGPVFCFPAAIDFVSRVRKEVKFSYRFEDFEYALSHLCELSDEEKLFVRGRIVGKHLPRECYQSLFPVGLGQVYPGAHIASAHGSPDVDTLVASFWGYMAAFGCGLSGTLQRWNLPPGPVEEFTEYPLCFGQFFGSDLLAVACDRHSKLDLKALDLMKSKGLFFKTEDEDSFSETLTRHSSATVVVDRQENYITDWRNMDIDSVRKLIDSIASVFRWYQNKVNLDLVHLLSKPDLTDGEFKEYIEAIGAYPLSSSDPASTFSTKIMENVDQVFKVVLNVAEGWGATFAQFANRMTEQSVAPFNNFFAALNEFCADEFFANGKIVEERSRLFTHMEKVLLALSDAFRIFRDYLDSLGVAVMIKQKVFGHLPNFLGLGVPYAEVRARMKSYAHLTVCLESKQSIAPMGFIDDVDVQGEHSGTVSLWDFSNYQETKVPDYLQAIAFLDHHKSAISTKSPYVANLRACQSSNTLFALLSFEMNDQYSTYGMDEAGVERELKNWFARDPSPESTRITQRLLQVRANLGKGDKYFVHPDREFIEYYHFLIAIFDDTDLLNKVSCDDVNAIAGLINRMKSISKKQVVEVISFDDIPMDKEFCRCAADRILQNKEVYSIYGPLFKKKEFKVDEVIEDVSKPHSTFFQDTKFLGRTTCATQFKYFSTNLTMLERHQEAIVDAWFAYIDQVRESRADIHLYVFLTSTVKTAQEVHQAGDVTHSHVDLLRIFAPLEEELGPEYLTTFLCNFFRMEKIKEFRPRVRICGKDHEQIKAIMDENLPYPPECIVEQTDRPRSFITIELLPELITSRKTDLAPNFPQKN
ncbi:MAG: hypothetical protein S4CHLAM102_04540 [Chlamydiia bacterium]|nr:hypothetical protein [Chlamydiia bacterium]